MTIQELKNFFDDNNIEYFEHEEKDNILCVRRCEVGAGGYDYLDESTPIVIRKKKFKFLNTEPKVCIIDCEYCCGCGGW